MRIDRVAACAFTKYRHFVRVASKCVDILLYPVECETLIEKAEIAFCYWEFRRAWESKY
jgi:hypothetical protein